MQPVLHLLSDEVPKPKDKDSELTHNIKTIVIHYMKDKLDDAATDDLLDISSLLAPRFKTSYVKPEKVDALKAKAMAEIMQ